MPFISSRVNMPMTPQQKETVKTELGQIITLIPGKSENWLMIDLADQCELYFRGDGKDPLAFIELKIFGKISDDTARKLTERICDLYETQLKIKKDNIYIKYEEVSKWGWNGTNL